MKSSNRVDQRPSIQFYVRDWLTEPGLRLCDLAARGLWIDLLCHLFQMPERGILRVKKSKQTQANASTDAKQTRSKMVADLVGRPLIEVEPALNQLIEHEVIGTLEDGTLYSRRMVRDESKRQAKIRAGRLGGAASGRSRTKHDGEAKRGSSSSTASATSLKEPPTPLEAPPISQLAIDAYQKTFGPIADMERFAQVTGPWKPGTLAAALKEAGSRVTSWTEGRRLSYLRKVGDRIDAEPEPEKAEDRISRQVRETPRE